MDNMQRPAASFELLASFLVREAWLQTSTKSQRKTENGCQARRGAESVQARLDLPFYLHEQR